jgi:FkbM family methyltransferase
MIGKLISWLLALLAPRLKKFVGRMRYYENDPEMVAMLRRVVGVVRDNAGVFHETSGRLFVADDVDGVPQCLVDVSDRSTIRWLYQRHLRAALRNSAARPLIIDLGANDGLIGSMSLNFVQLGWDAVLVEPLPSMMALARQNLERYRRDGQALVFIEAAVGSTDGESAFETDVPADLSSMEGHIVSRTSSTSRMVRTLSPESLTAQADVAPLLRSARPIVLSVDIEGQDLAVVTGLLESGTRPDFIIFESIRYTPDDLRVFHNHGYTHLNKIGWNEIYARSGPAEEPSTTYAA